MGAGGRTESGGLGRGDALSRGKAGRGTHGWGGGGVAWVGGWGWGRGGTCGTGCMA